MHDSVCCDSCQTSGRRAIGNIHTYIKTTGREFFPNDKQTLVASGTREGQRAIYTCRRAKPSTILKSSLLTWEIAVDAKAVKSAVNV